MSRLTVLAGHLDCNFNQRTRNLIIDGHGDPELVIEVTKVTVGTIAAVVGRC